MLTFKWSVQKEEQLNCISYLLSMPTVDIKAMHKLIDIMFKGHTQTDTAWLSHLKGKKRKWEEEKKAYSSFSCHCLISPFYKYTYLHSMENAQHQEYYSFPFHIILQFWLLFRRSLLLSSCKCIDPFIGAQRSDAFKATVLCIRMCQLFIALSNILLCNNELIS